MPHPIPVDYLELDGRTAGLLKREGIHTLADLRKRTYESLLDVRGMSDRTIGKIEEALEVVGAGRLSREDRDLDRLVQITRVQLAAAELWLETDPAEKARRRAVLHHMHLGYKYSYYR